MTGCAPTSPANIAARPSSTRWTASSTLACTTNTNDYTAKKSEWLFLANAYVDLGTWWCITPFVGVGVGLVNINISHFRDNNNIASGGGWAGDETTTNFAWALHAGLSYKVTPNFAVEFGYRYLNLGDGKTGDTINFNGSNLVNNPFEFKDITSHDFRLGLRWMCCDDGTTLRRAAYAPPPVYAPQPVYAQPAQVLQVPPTYAPPPPPVYAQPQYAPPPPPVYPQQQYAPPPQPTIRRSSRISSRRSTAGVELMRVPERRDSPLRVERGQEKWIPVFRPDARPDKCGKEALTLSPPIASSE